MKKQGLSIEVCKKLVAYTMDSIKVMWEMEDFIYEWDIKGLHSKETFELTLSVTINKHGPVILIKQHMSTKDMGYETASWNDLIGTLLKAGAANIYVTSAKINNERTMGYIFPLHPGGVEKGYYIKSVKRKEFREYFNVDPPDESTIPIPQCDYKIPAFSRLCPSMSRDYRDYRNYPCVPYLGCAGLYSGTLDYLVNEHLRKEKAKKVYDDIIDSFSDMTTEATEKKKELSGKLPLTEDHICFTRGHNMFKHSEHSNHQSRFAVHKCSRCGWEYESQYDFG